MSDESAAVLASILVPEAEVPRQTLPSSERFSIRVAARLRSLGLTRPEPGQADEADPRFFSWWLLRMADISYRQAIRHRAEVPPAILTRMRSLLRERPAAAERHAQLHIDVESSVRRAMAVAEWAPREPIPVLAVGDDDAFSLAWAALGMQGVHVVDIDERLLEFLRGAGERTDARIVTHALDVFHEPLPSELRRACAVAVTDPIRNGEDALQFVNVAVAALRREGPARLFLADHPDWNLEQQDIEAACRAMGLRRLRVFENLHAYPLLPANFPLRGEAAAVLQLDAEDVDRLIAHTSAWSHLYVFERA